MHTTSTNYVNVQSGGHGVAAHVGLHALGALADQLGLGESLSSRIAARDERAPLYDRGKVRRENRIDTDLRSLEKYRG